MRKIAHKSGNIYVCIVYNLSWIINDYLLDDMCTFLLSYVSVLRLDLGF